MNAKCVAYLDVDEVRLGGKSMTEKINEQWRLFKTTISLELVHLFLLKDDINKQELSFRSLLYVNNVCRLLQIVHFLSEPFLPVLQ